MKLKAMTFALFAAGLLAGLTLIAPATGADPPTTTSGTTTSGTTTVATTTTPTTTTTPVTYTSATDAISALSATSITVGPLTCSIGATTKPGDFRVGDRVRMYCANGVLFQIKADTPTTTTTTTTSTPTTTSTTSSSTNYTTATDAITALSATSITVGSLTCSIGSSSPKAGDFKVGDRARIYCASGVLAYLIRPDAPTTTTTTTTTTTPTSDHHDDGSTRQGTISALGSTSITVDGLTCAINGSSPSVAFKVGDKVGIGCAGGVLVKIVAATSDDNHGDLTTRLGTISALSSASITVDGLTCSIGTSSPSVSAFKVGDQVGIGCTNGVLAKIGTPEVDDGGFKVVVQLGSIVALNTNSITVGSLPCSLAATSPSLATYQVGDRVGVGCAGGILFMIGALPSTADVPKAEVKHALVQRFNGCIKHGNEHCTVNAILRRLVRR